ncbi:26881_t:CDS:2 [Dentiscutata erythropus]|uniref:26881_t:CDS:1 n=1 Tax=Dentiscutata erythropus TaxID=1348616 RepID=A0A9N9NMG5_9GLOM|nr:26881_t:CDS:2 [Dentiscutata erythropus]
MYDKSRLSRNEQYSLAYTTKQSPYLESVQEKTIASCPIARQMVSPVQGAFLKFLVQMSKATRVLEIGTLTGYSALCMAEGLKERGSEAKLVTLEKDEENFKAAKENVESSGLGHLIELKLGDAMDTISNLDNSIQYDLIFIDADKRNYLNYYNTILERNLLSDDGIIAVDNALFGGHVSRVAEGKDLSQVPPSAKHIHSFNEYVANDQRTSQILLPCFDGVSLIRKNL